MAVRRRDFNAGQNEKAVDWLTVGTHQTFFQHVSDRIAGVVVGHRDSVEAFRLRRGDQIFRTGNAVAREERVSVKIEIKGHAMSTLRLHKFFSEDVRFGYSF